jgi:hypothetical protein
VEQLKRYRGRFNAERNARLERFLGFISEHPTTFVRGAWLPDTVIKDNTQGGHTWKYKLDSENGRVEKRRPPDHNNCLSHVRGKLGRRVSLVTPISDLPDRCEALSQTIRDTIRITNKIKSGDVVVFNNSQVALFFLMLSHYVCDAHVPVHCDSRDFYTPSSVHPDLEGFWEKEIAKYYKISKKAQQFDLDPEGNLQLKPKKRGYEASILGKCDEMLEHRPWQNMNSNDTHWRALLGSKNNNIWDYLVAVCLVSFHMSQLMFPEDPPDGADYDTINIMEASPFKERVIELSPLILADAVNSVALLWLSTWERWELLAKGIK